MGSTPRTAEANWRERKQREWAERMSTGRPDSLTELEVQPDDRDITRPPKNARRAVRAWIRYAGEPVMVRGFAIMWTDDAMKIRWLTPKLEWHDAWVWIGAVAPREVEHGEDALQKMGLSVNSPRPFQPAGERRALGLGDR